MDWGIEMSDTTGPVPIEARQPVLRFAPSPTGRLHLGHALSALLNVEIARQLGGRLLIRIEDTDLTRCRLEHEVSILDDLAWLGVISDGPILRQSEHFPDYIAAAQRLAAMELLYPCFATRLEVQAAAALEGAGTDPDGAPVYRGGRRHLAPDEVARRKARGEPFAMRLDMRAAIALARRLPGGDPLSYIALDGQLRPHCVVAEPDRWGDVVLQRKDSPTSYHLAVVVDDHRQGISHVVRGADVEAATAIHRLLQMLLGLPAPTYHHHRLILEADGRKLSKRAGDTGLGELRAQGLSLQDIRRLVGLDAQMSR